MKRDNELIFQKTVELLSLCKANNLSLVCVVVDENGLTGATFCAHPLAHEITNAVKDIVEAKKEEDKGEMPEEVKELIKKILEECFLSKSEKPH